MLRFFYYLQIHLLNSKRWIFVFMLLCGAELPAQNLHAEGTLSHVDSSGFYRILLSPQATIFASEQFNNLRIYDSSNKEVPYLIRKEQPIYSHEEFKEYPIVEKKQLKGCCTSLTLSNPDKRSISNISLLIKNAEVSKRATLLGSDNQQEWYALKEHFNFHSIHNPSGTSEVRVVDFPMSNYNFLNLKIDDSTSAPLNILKAGYYDAQSYAGVYTEIPVKEAIVSDSASQKKTYIHLNLDTKFMVDKIELSMQGPPYFLRKAQLWQLIRKESKHGERNSYEFVSSFEVSSKKPVTLNLSVLKASDFRIVIENEDNPSLKMATIKIYQLNRYLIAWLKKDMQYKLRFENEKISPPQYDLTYFKDSIPAALPVLKLGSISLTGRTSQTEISTTFFTSKYFIWIAIGIVVSVLGLLSFRLIKDAGRMG